MERTAFCVFYYSSICYFSIFIGVFVILVFFICKTCLFGGYACVFGRREDEPWCVFVVDFDVYPHSVFLFFIMITIVTETVIAFYFLL